MTDNSTIFLDDRLLGCFCAAAEELHFARAAARMFMSQPPFSQQIKRLEEAVGARLFERTTRSVRLTPAGEVMYQHARRIAGMTAVMLRATKQAARGEGGMLVVGFAPSAAYSPLVTALHRYRSAYPEVELDLREMNSIAMESQLRSRLIDVAVMRPLPTNADVETVEVFREPMMLAMRQDHELAALRRLSMEQVAELPIIGYSQTASPYFRNLLNSMFIPLRKRPRIVQDSVIPTVLTLVEIGIGFALVPRTLVQMKSEELRFAPVLDRSNTMASLVVACMRDRTNAAVDGFIAAMREADRRRKASR